VKYILELQVDGIGVQSKYSDLSMPAYIAHIREQTKLTIIVRFEAIHHMCNQLDNNNIMIYPINTIWGTMNL